MISIQGLNSATLCNARENMGNAHKVASAHPSDFRLRQRPDCNPILELYGEETQEGSSLS